MKLVVIHFYSSPLLLLLLEFLFLSRATRQGNLEMVKSIALQRSVLLMSGRVHVLPKTVISRYSNTFAKKSKRLGIRTATWAAENGHLHILEYLVERKYDGYDEQACENAAMNGHLTV